MESFEEVSSILEHTASDGNFSRGNPIKSRINNIPHSSDDKCRAILQWGTKYKIMKSYFSIKPGATFFLGSSRTLVYHKDDTVWGQETL